MIKTSDILFGSLLGSGSGGGGKNGIVKLTSNVPLAVVGSGGSTRVKCSFSAEVTGDYAIQDYGIIFCNDGTVATADFTIEDVDGTHIKSGKAYSPNIFDEGSGVVARGFVKVNDQYIYTGNIGGKYADLKKPVLIEKTVSANGTYTAADDGADGYSKVTVSV